MANQSQKTKEAEKTIKEEKEPAYITLIRNPLDKETQELVITSKKDSKEVIEAFRKIGINRENIENLISDINSTSREISYIAEFCKNSNEKDMFALKRIFDLAYSKNEKDKALSLKEITEISKKNKMLGLSLQKLLKNKDISDYIAKKHMELFNIKKDDMHGLFSTYYEIWKDQKFKEFVDEIKTREKFKKIALLLGKLDLIQMKSIIEKFLNYAIASGASEESINAFASLLIKEAGSSSITNNFKLSKALSKVSEFFKQFKGDKTVANLVSEAYGSRKNL